MVSRATEKDYKAFLKEKGLQQTFNRYKQIRSIKKKEISVPQTNYDGSRRLDTYIVYKKKGYTIFRSKSDYKAIKRVKGTPEAAIKRILTQKQKVEYFTLNAKTVPKKTTQLPNTITQSRYIESQNVIRTKTLTNKPKKGMHGGAVVDATYIMNDNRRIRLQTQSSFGFRIGTEKGKNDSVNDAIRKGAYRTEGSPKEIIVHDYWFIFYNDVRAKNLR